MERRTERSQCDVVVIGGGPAGAVTAGQLARRGHRVVVLERARFPRFHIGESLLPASNAIFRTLGIEERLQTGGFVVKRGASFASDDGAHSSHIEFADGPEVSEPLTYQVERSRFDTLLLDEAAAAGADVRQERHVRDVVFDDDGVTVTATPVGDRTHGRDDVTETVHAAFVVDASGQAGFLAKRLGLREVDPKMQNVATHAQYSGVTRPAGVREGDIRIISCSDLSWIWFIPISESVTSVGFVMPPARRATEPNSSLDEALDRLLMSSPLAAEAMRGAKRIGPTRRDADFSYTTRHYAGDRWLLAGDAGSFIDPVFSTGVMVALESGVEAADALDQVLAQKDPSARAGRVRRAFRRFERIQHRRYQFFHRFAHGFYDPAFRDLLVQPVNRLRLVDALINILAGHWQPSWRTRLRAAIFFKLASVHRRFPIVERIHGLETNPVEAAGAS